MLEVVSENVRGLYYFFSFMSGLGVLICTVVSFVGLALEPPGDSAVRRQYIHFGITAGFLGLLGFVKPLFFYLAVFYVYGEIARQMYSEVVHVKSPKGQNLNYGGNYGGYVSVLGLSVFMIVVHVVYIIYFMLHPDITFAMFFAFLW